MARPELLPHTICPEFHPTRCHRVDMWWSCIADELEFLRTFASVPVLCRDLRTAGRVLFHPVASRSLSAGSESSDPCNNMYAVLLSSPPPHAIVLPYRRSYSSRPRTASTSSSVHISVPSSYHQDRSISSLVRRLPLPSWSLRAEHSQEVRIGCPFGQWSSLLSIQIPDYRGRSPPTPRSRHSIVVLPCARLSTRQSSCIPTAVASYRESGCTAQVNLSGQCSGWSPAILSHHV